MEKDAQDWVIWTAALRHAEHSERMRHPPVALKRPEETGRGERRGQAAVEAHAEAERRYQRAILSGTTEDMVREMGARDAAFAQLREEV